MSDQPKPKLARIVDDVAAAIASISVASAGHFNPNVVRPNGDGEIEEKPDQVAIFLGPEESLSDEANAGFSLWKATIYLKVWLGESINSNEPLDVHEAFVRADIISVLIQAKSSYSRHGLADTTDIPLIEPFVSTSNSSLLGFIMTVEITYETELGNCFSA